MARPNVVKLVGVDSKNGEIIAVYISHELSGYKGKFVPERPHGEWIKESLQIDENHFRSYARCKICGCSFKPYSFAAKEFDFCPKCGADMRKSGE